MTFSIVGHCNRTGMFGVAITTSSICVASRCPWVRAGVGAVATQNVTDPSLGPKLLDRLEAGEKVSDALDVLMAEQTHANYRQVTVVSKGGASAQHTGEQILGTHNISSASDCIAAGNLLSNEDVTQAMVDTFEANAAVHLGERLLLALSAGVAAGGEEGPTHSAGLKVAHEQSWPLVDLRIDWSDGEPVNELMGLWKKYEVEMDAYTTRALDPSAAPSYGVPGDL